MSAQPGDELVADATLVFDRERVIAAAPEAIWPWLLQLGKRRAGWYLPRRVERALPRGRRALRVIEPRWQELEEGVRIPDYGGRDAWLEVALIDASRALVYRSERHGGALFSWALLLEPLPGPRTRVHLRFRGRIRSRGLRGRLIAVVGGAFDWATSELMLRGLAERATDESAGGSRS